MEAPALKTQLDANSFRSTMPLPHRPQTLDPDALPAITLPICPMLGQRNVLDCMPCDLVHC